MLEHRDFKAWCLSLELSDNTCTFITQIRQSEPVRRVRGSGPNVCGRYPSVKMGKTIQFESHKVELPAIETYEADPEVLEYYDQPYKFQISFITKNGRRVRCKHVPDFLILRKSEVTFEEWKTEKQLLALSESQPNHYYQDKELKWHNPAAEKAARKYHIQYRLRSDSEINWLEYRNYKILRNYRNGQYEVQTDAKNSLINKVRETPGITITQLISYSHAGGIDDVYALVSIHEIYIDLRSSSLAEPNKVKVFENPEIAQAYHIISKIDKDDRFAKRISEDAPLSIPENLKKASPQDLEIANLRWRILQAKSPENLSSELTASPRTLRRWKSHFKEAEQLYGLGYIGLLPQIGNRGNRSERLSPQARPFIDKILEEHYETFQQKGTLAVYGILQREWEKAHYTGPCPSHSAFYRHVNRQGKYQLTKKRQGSRAAYQQSSFHWELSLTTPRHGDRPFELCHIDHTELDIELVCSRTGKNLGRPWATVLLDAFSRRVLSLYLSFEPPSYRACMMALRICVQRFERFPDTLVMDHGAEFNSIYFETLLATFHCTKKQRPSARPRFGSIMERFFGTANTELLYTLQGNTQSTKNVRQLTRHNNPKTLAVWTLEQLYSTFCQFAYEVYDQLPHAALGQSPREAFLMGIAQTGLRGCLGSQKRLMRVYVA